LSATEKIFVLTSRLIKLLKYHGYSEIKCHYCETPLREGDVVIRKRIRSKNGNHNKYYHVECWEKLWIS